MRIKPGNTQQVLFLILVSISCLVLASLLGLIFIPLFTGTSGAYLEMNPSLWSMEYVGAMKIFQVFSTLISFILPVYLFTWYAGEKSSVYLRLDKNPGGKALLFAIAFFIVVFPFLEWLVNLNMEMKLPQGLAGLEDLIKSWEDKGKIITERFLEGGSIYVFAFNLFVMAIVPAVAEEFFFRGTLQTFLGKWLGNAHVAIIITSFLFSFIHFQFYGFVPRMLLGVIFGYFFLWSGSIWTPVLLHFTNNAIGVTGYFLAEKSLINFKMDEPMQTSNWGIIVSFAVAAAFFIFLANYYSKRRKKNEDNWVKVYESDKITEAEIIRALLEENEIPAVVMNKRDSSYPSFGPVEIFVRPEDETKAIEKIKSQQDQQVSDESGT